LPSDIKGFGGSCGDLGRIVVVLLLACVNGRLTDAWDFFPSE